MIVTRFGSETVTHMEDFRKRYNMKTTVMPKLKIDAENTSKSELY